jgi:hypothetical protein
LRHKAFPGVLHSSVYRSVLVADSL